MRDLHKYIVVFTHVIGILLAPIAGTAMFLQFGSIGAVVLGLIASFVGFGLVGVFVAVSMILTSRVMKFVWKQDEPVFELGEDGQVKAED